MSRNDPACPFCAISPDRLIATSASAVAIRDSFPVTGGHTLIVPMRHVTSLFDLSPGEQFAIWRFVAKVRGDLIRSPGVSAFNIGTNDGEAAGQTISHAHVHIIPRRPGDVADPRGGIRWIIAEKAKYWMNQIGRGTNLPLSLPIAWQNALEQVQRRRSKLHYKPAALLIALDLLEQTDEGDHPVPYAEFVEWFAFLVSDVDPDGADRGWEPFYHLATGEQVWNLWHGGIIVDAAEIKPSASSVSKNVDEARFRDELKDLLRDRAGRQVVREAVLDMLRADDDPICLATVEEYQRRAPLALAETADEIRRSLVRFNSEAPQYVPFARDLARITTYWVYDHDSDLFGPSKFVGFKGMDSARYLYARTLGPKGPFDGHTTRLAIERGLGAAFAVNAELEVGLENWMARTFGELIADVDLSKRRFIELPPVAPGGNESDIVSNHLEPFAFASTHIEDLLEDLPSPRSIAVHHAGEQPARIDWASRDAANRRLGSAAEQFVAKLEGQALVEAGREDLAKRVEVVSQTQGDGLGYDILSFASDGAVKYIEVKATEFSKVTPFIITENERLRSEILGEKLWLYRLFKDSGKWRLFRLQGPYSRTLQLRPNQYRAVVAVQADHED